MVHAAADFRLSFCVLNIPIPIYKRSIYRIFKVQQNQGEQYSLWVLSSGMDS